MKHCRWEKIDIQEKRALLQTYLVHVWKCQACGKVVEDLTHITQPVSILLPEHLPCGLLPRK